MKKGRYDDEDWLAGTPISRTKKRATRSILSDEGASFAAKERVEQEISCYISKRCEDLDSVKSVPH